MTSQAAAVGFHGKERKSKRSERRWTPAKKETKKVKKHFEKKSSNSSISISVITLPVKMSLQAAFKTFASKNNNTEATTTDINKWCKDAGVYGKNLTANHTDIAFSKAKVKGAKNLTYNEMDALVAEMAVKYKDDKKVELDQAISDLKDKLANASSQLHGTTKTMKVGGVDRLTDTSKYTGSHKERFDETGKGKGMAGRENLTDNSGYVGNYKGSGTYDKGH